MVCPSCSVDVKGRRGKQKLSVMLDHLLDGCSSFKILDADLGIPVSLVGSSIEPGKLHVGYLCTKYFLQF